MEKIALITDTTADLSEDIINKYNVNVLPFRIIYKDREYKDRIDITPKEVYENLYKEIPTSSLPSMEDIDNLFIKLKKEGYTHAIAVVLSSGLSGIYNAVKLVSENHPEINTYVYDSKSISAGEAVFVEKCIDMINKNEKFSNIIKEMDKLRERCHLFFMVDTLEYLKRGGRIGKISGAIGELLNIKPIISIDKNDGKYYTVNKARGKKQSINKLIDEIKKILKNNRACIYMGHGNGLENCKNVYENIKKLNNILKVQFIGEISPVSGVHSGPGLVGIVVVEEP
ncbi:DegV family protein [Clostridium cochlearium]|uniref:DegV family protein n=1 Tax=Clostridium cochlearium TaxID=1494 RepID=A0A239ZLG9_CLOCO|nr:DegV family protein [Clostridium cochlearium]MBU5269691.1 DegV family protein [Clostridium cochlearium]MCG4578732.1 DegV family protein [Clostridium cochlearium]NME95708.1 DegV family protein [Clostridium cochlearium]NOH16653.1 DegV family protein [Clostridium cochlearium]SNV72112.1 degV family protein [Clostridium cochlearium]